MMQSVLNQEIKLPDSRMVAAAWRWLLAGLEKSIPTAFRKWGWRPSSSLILLNDDGSEEVRLIERSFFGAERVVDSISGNPPCDTRIALAPNDVFVTKCSLPTKAKKTLEQTIAMRLCDLSPLPSEDVVHAVGHIKEETADRISVEVAIARRSTLDEIKKKHQSTPLKIGAFANANGAMQFVFNDEMRTNASSIKPALLRAAALIASFFAIIAALDIHLGKRIDALTEYETALIKEHRALRPTLALFETVESADVTAAEPISITNALAEFDNAIGRQANIVLLQQATLTQDSVSITGYKPPAFTFNEAEEKTISVSASPYINHDRFDLSLERAP